MGAKYRLLTMAVSGLTFDVIKNIRFCRNGAAFEVNTVIPRNSWGRSPSQRAVPGALTCRYSTDFNSDARASTQSQLLMRNLDAPPLGERNVHRLDTTNLQKQLPPLSY
ncbi:hypothetical protein SprV_0401637400 [Sparganum proliferum]